MKSEITKPVVITCTKCKFDNVFNQPYRYHAGFGNQGFLYNESGNRTLIWSSFDQDYRAIVGERHPWALDTDNQRKLEEALESDPFGGGRWLFSNPAKCLKCGQDIAEPITDTIYYLEYDGSLNLDHPIDNQSRGLNEMMRGRTRESGTH